MGSRPDQRSDRVVLFISPHPQYQLLGIINEQDIYHPANGKYLRTEPAVNAEFVHSSPPSWAVDQALANPRFRSAWNGLPDGVDFRAYIGMFDTEAAQITYRWSDETREFVEDFLVNHPDNGLAFAVAELPEEMTGRPWPQYDQCHHMRIHIVAQELGKDLAEVKLYEQTHQNRPVVIQKLEEAMEGTPEAADDLVAA